MIDPSEHLGLVYKASSMIAERYGGESEEYIGEMYEHMCKAARYFSADKGYAWSTYAMRCMMSNAVSNIYKNRRRFPLVVDPSKLDTATVIKPKMEARSLLDMALLAVADDETTTAIFTDVMERRAWHRSLSRTELGVGRAQFYRCRRLLGDLVSYLRDEHEAAPAGRKER